MAVITGTAGIDNGLASPTVRGTLAADTIDLLGGSDVLFGNAGDDALRGSEQDDVFVPGIGSATAPELTLQTIDLAFYDGADSLDGGPGVDRLIAAYAPLADGVSPLVVVDLTAGTGTGGDQEGDRYKGIEIVTVVPVAAVGAAGRAKLVGSATAETFVGADGDDLLEGRGGADTLLGGDGGLDTASYLSSQAGVTVDLTVSAQVSAGDANGDRIDQVEALLGSAFADTLRADAGANRLDGGGGNDRLEGRAGDDTYLFSAGTDTILDTGGADKIEAPFLPGAATRVGDDLVLDFGTKGKMIVDDHFKPSPFDSTSFPNVVETLVVPNTGQKLVLARTRTGGPVAGIISGDETDETLDGAGGDDLVFGNGGADIVIGGEGDDILSGGKGPDIFLIRPGDGNDVIRDFTIRGKNADRLDLTAFGFESADDVLANLAKVDGKTVLTLGEDQTLTFERLGGKLTLANLILEAEG